MTAPEVLEVLIPLKDTGQVVCGIHYPGDLIGSQNFLVGAGCLVTDEHLSAGLWMTPNGVQVAVAPAICGGGILWEVRRRNVELCLTSFAAPDSGRLSNRKSFRASSL